MGSNPIVGFRYKLVIGANLVDSSLKLVMGLDKLGGYPSGQRGLTVNQLADAFGGSNPSPPT